MKNTSTFDQKRAEKALGVITYCWHNLFDRASIMMQSVDKDGKLLNVNRQWLDMLGYDASEALGRPTTDFLSEVSPTKITSEEQLPLFWRAGSARDVGIRLVRKDGRILDVLLDTEVNEPTETNCFCALGALHDRHDLVQRRLASSTLRALQALKGIQCKLESILSLIVTDPLDPAGSHRIESSYQGQKPCLAAETQKALIDASQNITWNLCALARVQRDWLHAMLEHQTGLLLAVETIEFTLAELAGAVVEARYST